MPQIPAPSWLLLLWCGLAASLAGELVAASLRPSRQPRRRGEASSPRFMSGPRENPLLAILAGTLLFAPLYGFFFEAIHRADIETGAIAGAAYGIIAASITLGSAARRRRDTDVAATPMRALALFRLRRMAAHVAFGAVLGFLYAVPGPPA